MSATIDRIVAQVRALPLDEQRQLREELNSIVTAPTEDELEDQFEQHLMEQGLLSEIPKPPTDFSPYRDYEPIKIS